VNVMFRAPESTNTSNGYMDIVTIPNTEQADFL
jgi:hypothetical protein